MSSLSASTLLVAVLLFGSVGCAPDDSDDAQGPALTSGESAAAAPLEAPCGAKYTCTLFVPDDAPIGPLTSRSHRSGAMCFLDDVKTAANEVTALVDGGDALFFGNAASWSMEQATLVLVPGGTRARVVCAIASEGGGASKAGSKDASKPSLFGAHTRCTGTPQSCSYRSPGWCVQGCSASYGSYNTTSDDSCDGTPDPCEEASSEKMCDIPGCTWQ